MVEFIIRRQFTPAWTKIFGGGGEARKKNRKRRCDKAYLGYFTDELP